MSSRILVAWVALSVVLARTAHGDGVHLDVEQITSGEKCHLFGYIGHVRTIPWNASGRYIVALRASFHDRMPRPEDAAEIVLLDTQADYSPRVVERTRAWNLQQGTMLYWHPAAAERQFFFNDRDPRSGHVFCVLFDVEKSERIREYRFGDTPCGNSGVAQGGAYFLAINYGRLARLRPVTGYPGVYDWTKEEKHPSDDGVFKIDITTGSKELLVSFARLA